MVRLLLVQAACLYFRGPHRAVLISYPSQKELETQVYEGL